MLTRALRAMRGSFVVVSLLACAVATASAATDKKETTKRSWAVDASHGTFSERIPIEVPAFRGITPGLALTYDSSEGNGWLGVGWSLDGVGVIERASPGKGAPRYDATDIFLLDGRELVACAPGSVSPSCTTGGTHSTKIESYMRIAFTGTGPSSRWTITEKDGTRSVYAPVFSASGGANVFRWGLEQVIDMKGNVVTYNWAANQFGCCWEYPDSVTYNGTTVKFHYEQRSDRELAAAGAAGLRTLHGRIKTIDVTVSGSRLRAYKLGYATSGATARSLLSSVQQFGKDAALDGSGTVTGGASLPAISIDYQVGTPAFALGSNDVRMASASGAKSFAIDIDGDGKTDMLELYPSFGAMRRKTWISNGSGFTQTSDAAGMSGATDTRFLPMDVNGDGKTDVVEVYPNFLWSGIRTWVANGTGFALASTNGTATSPNQDSRFLAMDINGDGKSDMVELYPSFLTYRRRSWISTGTGFTKGVDEAGIRLDADSRFLAMDVNGDGKSDLVELFEGLGTWGRHIWLSNGAGFQSGAQDSSMGLSADSQFLPMDVNGDGKTDMLELYPVLTSYFRRVWLSTGYSFTASSNVAGFPFSASNWFLAIDMNGDERSDLVEMAPTGLFYQRQIWLSVGGGFVAGPRDVQVGFNSGTQIMAADVDGDGLSEVIELYPAFLAMGRRVWSMTGAYPDLLASLTGSLGGTTSVSYTPSSAWANTNNPPLVQTASEVTADDGRGGSVTTTYEYAGGLYDRLEKRFLGFRHHQEALPCIAGEVTCPYAETWFRQDFGAASKPERVDHRSGDGQLLRAEIFEYTTNGATVPWTSLPTGEWAFTYVGGGAACPGAECKRTYKNRTFNAFGELAVAVDHGDFDVAGDEDTLTTTFVPNTTAYIVNQPAEAKTFEGVGTGGALLKQALTFYDGATRWDQPPSAGLATTEVRWLSNPSSFVETHTEYDARGNVTADIDALGARTEHTFDPIYHLFETSTTNPLGQESSTTWDVVCGAPTQTTDRNGRPTTMTYDPLCRMVEMVEPGGRFERHTWVNLGDAGSQHEVVETPAADGTTSPLWTRTYFDGYRRTWRAVARGPDAATGDIHVDTTYNARGLEASRTAPYYWVSGQAQPTTHVTTFGHDALDRLVRMTHPDEAFATKSYNLWSVTDTDELGSVKTDHFDADGRRVAHDELVGGAIETTTYVYDARGNLARSIDPLDNVITYATDSLGRQTLLDDPNWGAMTYEHDGADRRTAQTDAKGQRTEFGYDALDRKTSKTSLAGSGSAVTVSWTYDQVRAGYHNIGELTTTTDESGSKTFDYDVAGNVVKTVRTIDGSSYTFENGFDQGNRKLWTVFPDGDTLGDPDAPLEYDSAGRLASIPGYVTSAQYGADGTVVQINNANGTVTTRPHSAERGWLDSITTMSGATAIQDLAYTRNPKGMITQVQSPRAGESWTYGYDELDRLTIANNASGATDDQTIEYDAIGNITSSSRLGAYSYGSSRPHAVTAAGSRTYAYDAAGLMTSGAGRTLTWDGDNRLASITGGGTTMTCTYDADGARIQQVEGAVTRRHLGDGYEIQLGGSTIKYVSLAGSVVARKEGSTTTWIHTDHLGSIHAATDASGAEVHRKTYRPYGEVLSTGGATSYEPLGFTGQRHDASGLVYLHARYYDPALARFISPDPIISGQDTIGLNRYAYAANDPVGNTDVDGYAPDKERKPKPWSRVGARHAVEKRVVQLRVVRNPNGTVTLSRFASEASKFTITLKRAAASLGVAASLIAGPTEPWSASSQAAQISGQTRWVNTTAEMLNEATKHISDVADALTQPKTSIPRLPPTPPSLPGPPPPPPRAPGPIPPQAPSTTPRRIPWGAIGRAAGVVGSVAGAAGVVGYIVDATPRRVDIVVDGDVQRHTVTPGWIRDIEQGKSPYDDDLPEPGPGGGAGGGGGGGGPW
jgi:RHS repeat-associated protein